MFFDTRLAKSTWHRRSLYEEAQAHIRDAISLGKLADGTILTEAPLADIFGFSRAPVRQALKLLASEGIISRFKGRGYVVGNGDGEFVRADLGPAFQHLAPMVERPPLAWKPLYEEVERIVVYHSFFGSARLIENELALYYDVGRLVARDVLIHLESKGIVEKNERSRWSVVPLDDQRIADLFCLRTHLESAALVLATEFITPDVCALMMARLVDALDRYPDVTAAMMYDLEVDLHVRALEYCPNKELLHALQRTHCVQTLSKHVLGVHVAMPNHEPFLEGHIEVFRQIERQNRDAAGRAMTRHIRESLPKVIERAAVFRDNFTTEPCAFIR